VTACLSNSDCRVESEAKVIEEVPWTKADSAALAAMAAKAAANPIARLRPKNKASRQAIRAAKKWLRHPSEKKRLSPRLLPLWSMILQDPAPGISAMPQKAQRSAPGAQRPAPVGRPFILQLTR